VVVGLLVSHPAYAIPPNPVRVEARNSARYVGVGYRLASQVQWCERTSRRVHTCYVTLWLADPVSETFAACGVHVRVFVRRGRVTGSSIRSYDVTCADAQKEEIPIPSARARRRSY
jgi:hypothetical protein